MKKVGVYWVLGGVVVAVIGLSNITTTKVEEVEESIPYAVEAILDADLREGTEEVREVGKNGLKRVSYIVTYRTGSEVKRDKQSEDVLVKPVNKVVAKGTKKYYTCSNGVEYESLEEKNACEAQIESARQKKPTPAPTKGRIGAICKDGWRSNATGKGACSRHGGVAQWLYN